MLITIKLFACYEVRKNLNKGARARRAGVDPPLAYIYTMYTDQLSICNLPHIQ